MKLSEQKRKIILFNQCKSESHTPSSKFKSLAKRLRSVQHKVQTNKDDITFDKLVKVDLVIFGFPKDPITEEEMKSIHKYVKEGGSFALFVGEGKDGLKHQLNSVNELLKPYGVSVMNSTVVRTSYYKYSHPKYALIADGIVHPEINEKQEINTKDDSKETMSDNLFTSNNDGLSFVYPNGTFLNVGKPSITVLSSGIACYPHNRPLASLCSSETSSRKLKGKVLVVGSSDLFSESWIEKEGNMLLSDVLMGYLLNMEDLHFDLKRYKSKNIISGESHTVPDFQSLSSSVKGCLQREEPLPQDFDSLFKNEPFGYDVNLIPGAIALYRQLNVEHAPITLIRPEFEKPLPPFVAATFLPSLAGDLTPPALDLFDLDEHFSSIRVKLACLTNKCKNESSNDDTVNYFVKEAGEMLGVSRQSAKKMIGSIFQEVVQYKMKSQKL